MSAFRRFLHSDAAGGVSLMFAALLAMLAANSSFSATYVAFAHGAHFWVNDLLMALFFLYMGLEIKREIRLGTLSTRSRALLPVLAAAGGMLVPALIYIGINWATPAFESGWAIPTATDIAFALGALALVASRLPPALKILLMAIAVIDDLGAILVIALFYTEQLDFQALAMAVTCMVALWGLNHRGVRGRGFYLLVGAVLWAAMLKSGIHPTLAGVITALAIPMDDLKKLQDTMHELVIFLIMPLFAFVNAGVSLSGFQVNNLWHPITLGIALGLFLGKQLGIFGSIYLLTKTRICTLADGVTWTQIYGISLLCGIGFTMALFVGDLAFTGQGLDAYVRMGVLGGSVLSAILGCAVLYKTAPHK